MTQKLSAENLVFALLRTIDTKEIAADEFMRQIVEIFG